MIWPAPRLIRLRWWIADAWRRLNQQWKFPVAYWLDRRRPDLCWAALVLWALGYQRLGVAREMPCMNDADDDQGFCGKCLRLGRKGPRK